VSAAVRGDPAAWRGLRVATPLCGANLTAAQARDWLAGAEERPA
jgi:hypothetical protein